MAGSPGCELARPRCCILFSEAESDDDEAESDDDRERIAKLEAIEHGEVDWDDDDVYSLGRGQAWSSVDHLA